MATKADATTLADTTKPIWMPDFPVARNIRDFSFGFEVQTDEATEVFYVVVTNETSQAATVEVSHVVAGTDGTGATPVAAGTLTLSGPATSALQTISDGVTASTGYHVYLVARDVHGNTQADVTDVALSTGPDVTPPVWVSEYPQVSAVEDFLVNFTLALDEAGYVDWVLVPGADQQPTLAALRAGNSGSGQPGLASGRTTVHGSARKVAEIHVWEGLSASTTYRLWAVATDVFGNSQLLPVNVSVTTLPDTTPPQLDGSPFVENVGDFQLDVVVSLGEPGSVFYVVLPAAMDIPTPSQVQAGILGQASIGSFAIPTRHTQTRHHIDDGLLAETEYNLVLVAQDDEATPNVQTAVFALNFTTGPDVTPPVTLPGYPTHANLGDFEFDLVLRTDEPSTCWWVVLYMNLAPPTIADVVAGTDGEGNTAIRGGSTTVVVPVTSPVGFAGNTSITGNLRAETDYDVWVVCQDDEPTPNRQTQKSKLTLRTIPDETPPVFTPGWPKPAATEDFAIDLGVSLDEPGRWFWVVTPAGGPAPTVAQVLSGWPGVSLDAGSVDVHAGEQQFVGRASSGLLAVTNYDVWSLAQDDEPIPNVQQEVHRFNVTTIPDETPPVWVSSSPAVAVVEDFTIVVDAALDEPGTVWWIVAPGSAVQPTVAQLRAGNDGSGQPGVMAGSAQVDTASTTIQVTITGALTAETWYEVFVFAEVGMHAGCVLLCRVCDLSVVFFTRRTTNPCPIVKRPRRTSVL